MLQLLGGYFNKKKTAGTTLYYSTIKLFARQMSPCYTYIVSI